MEVGIKKKEKTNFISSLIEDAKNIKKYLSSVKLKRASTTFYNNITTKFPEGNITKNYLEQMNKNDLIEYDDYIEYHGKKIYKPFVENL